MNVIREHPVRSDVLDQLYEAGTSAWTRGAHEVRVIDSAYIHFFNSRDTCPFPLLARSGVFEKCTGSFDRRAMGN